MWGPDPVTFRSPRFVIDNASVLPKPASKIPVMLGGVSPKAVQRIVRRADGWLPFLNTPGQAGAAELRASWARIRELTFDYGRDTSRMEMVVVGNVTFTDRQGGPDRTPFVGTLDQNHRRCPNGRRGRRRRAHHRSEPAGLVHQYKQMLETAMEIRERAAVS